MAEQRTGGGSERRVRFGIFEANLSGGELCKSGRPVRLQDQPFRILKVLLQHPGEVVTREQLRREIWNDDVYVDFDRSLNTSVARLREALGDSPTRPTYIETVPRTGYRFIAPIDSTGERGQADESGKVGAGRAKSPLRLRWAAVVCGLALTIFLASKYWVTTGEEAAPRAPLGSVRLTYYPGIEAEPSFSPDGNQIAFTWNGDKEDNFDVYVRTMGGSNLVRLTDDRRRDFSPAWSPDGQWVAFVRDLGGGSSAVYRIPPLGGREEKLFDLSWSVPARSMVIAGRELTWSPDSRYLVVGEQEGDGFERALWAFSPKSGAKHRLTRPRAGAIDRDPAISPDGRFLAFTRAVPGRSSVYVLPLGETLRPTGEPTLVSGNDPFEHAVWTLDGKRLIAVADLWSPSLWTLDPFARREPERLPVATAGGMFPAVGRGGKLAFTPLSHNVNVWRLDLGKSAATASPIELLSSAGFSSTFQYSPDGSRIAFQSNRSAPTGIWIANADGTNPALLYAPAGTPRWSPDGNWIAFDSNQAGNGDVWIVNVTGGAPRLLTQNEANDRLPTWSRNGEWIYFMSDRSGLNQVWKMRPGGGDALPVTQEGGGYAIESADGKHLYYHKGQPSIGGSVWRVPVLGGREEPVLERVSAWSSFAPASEGIYFSVNDIEGMGSSVRFLDFATNSISEIHRSPKPVSVGVDVSPDGRYLLFAQVDSLEGDLMVVENFQ